MMSTSQQIKLITLKQELYVPSQCTIYSKSQRLTLYDRDHVIFYSKLAGATTWPTLHFFYNKQEILSSHKYNFDQITTKKWLENISLLFVQFS